MKEKINPLNPQEVYYPDEEYLKTCLKKLESLPPLIFAAEARVLKTKLAAAAKGEAFVLQGGDCAESFANFSADKIRDDLKLLLQMAVILAYESSKPIIKLARFAGQFAKPRSSLTQTKNNLTLPSFRGDIINGIDFDLKSRTPDPGRMIKAYFQSASSLNLMRAFMSGGLADLEKLINLNLDFTSKNEYKRYKNICEQVSKTLGFIKACGLKAKAQQSIYSSHEALLLPYEKALSRVDSMSGKLYACSAHQLWIGERTNDPKGEHIQFLKTVQNPLGVKIGPSCSCTKLLNLCEVLNPANEEGRLSLIFRLGKNKINSSLPPLLAALKENSINATLLCDPMHANTKTINSLKTRSYEEILSESLAFLKLCKEANCFAGGFHLEMCGQDVKECIGGSLKTKLDKKGFTSLCDPRLNATQALEFAFDTARLI